MDENTGTCGHCGRESIKVVKWNGRYVGKGCKKTLQYIQSSLIHFQKTGLEREKQKNIEYVENILKEKFSWYK